jgi:hypothetical protein
MGRQRRLRACPRPEAARAPSPGAPTRRGPARPRARAPPAPQTEALATAAVRAATKLRAALIVVFTVTGRTARLIAKYRPAQPILTVRARHWGPLPRAAAPPLGGAQRRLGAFAAVCPGLRAGRQRRVNEF